MPTVSYVNCGQSWDKVLGMLRSALRKNNYPASAHAQWAAGHGNVCVIVHDNKEDQQQVIYATNEGGGGMHSEPAGLSKIQTRSVKGTVYLFTERAPCGSCQQSLQRWADTMDADISVHYLTPWTDTDTEVDAVMKDVESGLSAAEIRDEIKSVRKKFV